MLVLASASPRRRGLLDRMGLAHEVVPADIDETPRPGERPEALVARLAEAKATHVLRSSPATAGDLVVLAADTVVVIDGAVLGKPADAADAAGMLGSLSGRTHEVLTGVAVARPGSVVVVVERTAVTFGALDEGEIEAYVATGEPLDKAGAYGIQGRGGNFVTRIEGSYDNVVGLPTRVVRDLLHPLRT